MRNKTINHRKSRRICARMLNLFKRDSLNETLLKTDVSSIEISGGHISNIISQTHFESVKSKF